MSAFTEDEAKGKWCPFALSASPIATNMQTTMGTVYAHAGHNRDNPSNHIPACIASSCMAWRWQEPKILREIDLVEEADVVAEKPRLGYCGLCGKPEWGI